MRRCVADATRRSGKRFQSHRTNSSRTDLPAKDFKSVKTAQSKVPMLIILKPGGYCAPGCFLTPRAHVPFIGRMQYSVMHNPKLKPNGRVIHIWVPSPMQRKKDRKNISLTFRHQLQIVETRLIPMPNLKEKGLTVHDTMYTACSLGESHQ